MDKSTVARLLNTLAGVSAGYAEASSGLCNQISQIRKEVENFSVYVPFIGLFSAGKSALLNHYIGENVLPVDQPPTTSLATELRFDSHRSLEVLGEDGITRIIERFPKNAEEANGPEFAQCSVAICKVPSDALRELKGVVLVDMPGTDSGMERHAKALFKYLNRGTAFAVVVDAGNGTLHPSLERILGEVGSAEKPVMLMVHKYDKYSEEKLESVSEELCNQVERLLGGKPEVLVTSVRDPQTPEKLHSALKSLDPAKLCDAAYGPAANICRERLLSLISTLLQGISEDTSDIDRKIYLASEARKDAEDSFKRNRKKLDHELRNTIYFQVMDEVRNTLNNNLAQLCDAAMQGEHAFVLTATALVQKTASASLEKNIKCNFEGIIIDITQSTTISSEELKSTILATTNTAQTLLDGALKIVKTGGRIYKILSTSLAVMTSVVNPIIELIIIFLPDIISFFSKPEEARRKQIQNQISGRLIPEICACVGNSLREELPQIGKEMFEALQEEFLGVLAEHEAALQAALREKDMAREEIQKRKNRYLHDLELVRNT